MSSYESTCSLEVPTQSFTVSQFSLRVHFLHYQMLSTRAAACKFVISLEEERRGGLSHWSVCIFVELFSIFSIFSFFSFFFGFLFYVLRIYYFAHLCVCACACRQQNSRIGFRRILAELGKWTIYELFVLFISFYWFSLPQSFFFCFWCCALSFCFVCCCLLFVCCFVLSFCCLQAVLMLPATKWAGIQYCLFNDTYFRIIVE